MKEVEEDGEEEEEGEEGEEDEDTSHFLFHHAELILHRPLLMRQGSKPGRRAEIYGRQRCASL